jgi:poly-gamma-glutamate synthesis protein (capsule biosynthesis protein)
MAPLTLFLAGDVMTGRGIDQVLPHAVDPRLHEPWVKDARRYLDLAEAEHGEIPAPVGYDYVWGEALAELERAAPAARIVNLETAVTTHDEPWPGKGIHYRMHPANAPVLTTPGIDCCVLANNHVLDWGRPGLEETLDALRRAGLRKAGAGRDLEEARAPAVLPTGVGGRVLVVALGSVTSGVPRDWAATEDRSGVFLLPASPADPVEAVPEVIEALDRVRRPGDLVVASIHQGGNWGWGVPPAERRLAHALIDRAGVAVVHGHSSHHVKGIEVHRGRLILYGCGDLLTDYEGIGGYEEYRGGLALLYLPELDPATGELRALTLTPVTQRRFRLERTSEADARWLAALLTREGKPLGTSADLGQDGRLRLRWEGAPVVS